ncbi:ankyrin repeat-containing domain protein [Aspergillus venezuelensis]
MQLSDQVIYAASLGLSQQNTLNEISRGCQDVLYDLINRLVKYEDILNNDSRKSGKSFRKSTRKAWNRLTFDQGEIDSYRRRTDSNVAAFEITSHKCQTSQLSREANVIVTVTQAGVNQLVQAQDENRRREILEWLSPSSHDAKQADLFGRIQPGTGGWLLESDEYRRWTDQSHDGDQTVDMKKESDLRTLFFPGLPGSGKTFLSSIVVDELQRNGNPLVFFYCNFREKTTLDEILGILLRQLAQQQAVPLSALETLTFIVLDALDEYQLPGGQRRRLLTELLNLQRTRDLQLFMTSRDNPDIAALFERSLSLRIRASAADVERFLGGQLENLPRVVQQKEDLQREVTAAITESHGWDGKRSVKQIREGLKTLPTGLDAAYVEAWSRIESQLPDQLQTAKDALSWISCATRPLTTLELVHALAIEEGLSYLDEDNIPDSDDVVVAACGGLGAAKEAGKCQRLLSGDNLSACIVGHQSIMACLRGDFQNEMRGVHLAACNGLAQACLLLIDEDEGGNIDSTTDHGHTALWLATQYGYSELVEILLDKGASIEAREIDKGCTPLWAAIQSNHAEVFHVLANARADMNAKSKYGKTPIYLAAEFGHLIMAKLLLARGVDLNAVVQGDMTPLGYAARNGHEAVFRLLLEAIGPGKVRIHRCEILRDAAIGGNKAMLRLILDDDDLAADEKAACAAEKSTTIIKLLLDEHGANPTTKDNDGRTPLSHAVCANFTRCYNLEEAGAIIQLLLEREGVDANSDELNAMRKAIVRILIDHGARVDLRDLNGETPLSYAAKLQLSDIVSMLLKQGAEVDATDKRGRTPLSHAVDLNFENEGDKPADWEMRVSETVRVLLDNGASAAVEDEDGLTPLTRARSRLPGHYVLTLLEGAL